MSDSTPSNGLPASLCYIWRFACVVPRSFGLPFAVTFSTASLIFCENFATHSIVLSNDPSPSMKN